MRRLPHTTPFRCPIRHRPCPAASDGARTLVPLEGASGRPRRHRAAPRGIRGRNQRGHAQHPRPTTSLATAPTWPDIVWGLSVAGGLWAKSRRGLTARRCAAMAFPEPCYPSTPCKGCTWKRAKRRENNKMLFVTLPELLMQADPRAGAHATATQGRRPGRRRRRCERTLRIREKHKETLHARDSRGCVALSAG